MKGILELKVSGFKNNRTVFLCRNIKEDITMSLTNNPNVLKWVEEMTALTKPDKVVWIDGSKEQIEALKKEALSTGEMQELNQEKLPGCLYHRTLPNDVARVEDRTFICCKNKEDAGPTNNWCDPEEMYAKLRPMYDGVMKG